MKELTEHPTVYQINKTGHPEKEPDIYGTDFFGNEVYYGDEIYIHDEEFWLVEDLDPSEIALLEHFGATKVIANFETKEK